MSQVSQVQCPYPQSPGSVRMFFIMIELLPSKRGVDVNTYLHKLDTLFHDYSNVTNILYKFKVSGECKILSVVQATNVIGLERSIAGLWRLGAVKVDCVPIIAYEHFAHNIQVNEHLTKASTGKLSKEGLYWLEFDVEHPGKSTEELINLWRSEAEAVLTSRHKDGTSIELYKVVAQRKVHVFINAESPENVDMLSLRLPLMQENGAYVHITCRAMQMLDDYNKRITSELI